MNKLAFVIELKPIYAAQSQTSFASKTEMHFFDIGIRKMKINYEKMQQVQKHTLNSLKAHQIIKSASCHRPEHTSFNKANLKFYIKHNTHTHSIHSLSYNLIVKL